jgi:hypothetical protein
MDQKLQFDSADMIKKLECYADKERVAGSTEVEKNQLSQSKRAKRGKADYKLHFSLLFSDRDARLKQLKGQDKLSLE